MGILVGEVRHGFAGIEEVEPPANRRVLAGRAELAHVEYADHNTSATSVRARQFAEKLKLHQISSAKFSRLERLIARDHSDISATGRTIARVHSARRERAIVLLHGLSKNPSQFERMAGELFARGYNVLVPRLPRHGHADPLSTGLERLRPEDLYDAIAQYVAIAYELGELVTIAGFSLGGLLAAWAAQHHAVERAVPIAPFLGLSWVPTPLMRPLAEQMLRVPNRFHWWNLVQRERRPSATGYPRYATHAFAHSYRIAQSVLEAAQTSRPAAKLITIVANAADVGVNNGTIRRLYERWRSQRADGVELIVLTGLPFSHDLFSPLRRGRLAARAHPHLVQIIDPATSAPPLPRPGYVVC